MSALTERNKEARAALLCEEIEWHPRRTMSKGPIMNPTYPPKLKDLVGALTDYGWNFVVNHGKDTGERPYISTEARRGNEHVMITWHTRATGTYRLFTCMVNKRDVSLTKALEVVAA